MIEFVDVLPNYSGTIAGYPLSGRVFLLSCPLLIMDKSR